MITKLVVHSKEPFLAKGLESILRPDGEFHVVPSCSTRAALREEISRTEPGIVLLELGPEVTFPFLIEITQQYHCHIVLWVNSISPELAIQAMSLGVRGILRKTLSPKLQVECLRRVRSGDVWFEKTVVDPFDTPSSRTFTRREGQILNLLSQGLKNREIAVYLSVSEGTVKVYLTKLFQKVGAKDRFDLALFGLKHTMDQSPSVEDYPLVEKTYAERYSLPLI